MIIFYFFNIYIVCESILGLLLLISINYEFGHQKIKSLNLIF